MIEKYSAKTTKNIPMDKAKQDKFFDLVRRMRGYQKEFEKYHSSQDRDRARRVARDVDAMIVEEVKEQRSQQANLF